LNPSLKLKKSLLAEILLSRSFGLTLNSVKVCPRHLSFGVDIAPLALL